MNPRSDLSTEMIDDSRVASEHMHENLRAADATAQAGAELMSRNAEIIQEAVQSGAEMAVRMSEYSAANINAIMKSNVDLVEVTRTMPLDWIRFAQEHIEHGFDWFRSVLEYRAPQHFADFHEEWSAAVLTPLSHTHGASATSPSAWQTS